jgi:hypothetical protein
VVQDSLTDDQLVDLLQRYLTILQGHPSAEDMMREVLTEDFETGFIGGHVWKAPSPVSEEFTGKCFHAWRVREVDGQWRVAAQMVERFADLNDNSERLFATPEEGLNR